MRSNARSHAAASAKISIILATVTTTAPTALPVSLGERWATSLSYDNLDWVFGTKEEVQHPVSQKIIWCAQAIADAERQIDYYSNFAPIGQRTQGVAHYRARLLAKLSELEELRAAAPLPIDDHEVGDEPEFDGDEVEDEPEIAAVVGFWDDPKWRNTSYPMRLQLYEQSHGRCPHPGPQR